MKQIGKTTSSTGVEGVFEQMFGGGEVIAVLSLREWEALRKLTMVVENKGIPRERLAFDLPLDFLENFALVGAGIMEAQEALNEAVRVMTGVGEVDSDEES